MSLLAAALDELRQQSGGVILTLRSGYNDDVIQAGGERKRHKM